MVRIKLTTPATLTDGGIIDENSLSEGSEFDEQIGEGVECFTRPDAADYRGEVDVTVSGRTCQRWNSQSPHSLPSTEKFGEDSNWCRNFPGSEKGAWCFTTDSAKRWEYCDVGEFKDECVSKPDIPDLGENVCDGQDPECYTDRYGSDYLGHVHVTENGRTCQMWNIDYPHTRKNKYKPASDSQRFGDHNYCRNLEYSTGGMQLSYRRRPWCYTTDPDVKWEYCDVQVPCDNEYVYSDWTGYSHPANMAQSQTKARRKTVQREEEAKGNHWKAKFLAC
ncbi:plasminogen-like [Asterias amurensis]|uniref:plasminogen-like n=1 Tax=Asterias amurensis TaxID=7602 RepID=UPI003AB464D4